MNTLTEKLRALRQNLEVAHTANPPQWATYYINITLALATCVIAIAILQVEPNRFQVISSILLLLVCGGSLILMLVGRLTGWGQ